MDQLLTDVPPPREFPVPALARRWEEQADRLESQAECKGVSAPNAIRWRASATALRVCAAQLLRVLEEEV